MKEYMNEKKTTLLYEPKYGIDKDMYDKLCEIHDYIDSSVIFTNEGGMNGNKERLDKIDFYISCHNNAISLSLGDDVRNKGAKYLYVFGCQDKNLISLIGYFKNGDTHANLIKDEFTFDIGSLKDFIYDRAYNYINELEAEDEWMDEFEYQKDFEEMESELE